MIGKTYTSRLKNSKRNIVAGLFRQLVTIILSFVIRTVVIFTLGIDYQGLSGLFTSILQVLNLTELGFSAAVTYVLFKPIADNDTEAICAILSYLKKVYRIIGAIILVVGLALLPLLPYLIKDEYPQEINIYVLYIIYLVNTVISYCLYAYKSTLLTAMQRIDLVSNACTIASVICKILQIVVLIAFKNYYFFVLLILLDSVTNNILVEVISRRVYPNLYACGQISAETKKQLMKHVKAVFIGKIGDVSRNSFDNIVLSAILGLVVVGIYDNYYYIYAALYGIMGIIVQSIRASIGNSLVKESVDKNYTDLLKFTFVFMWIVGWCSVCLFVLYQPFMIIWMKGDINRMLPFRDMLLFCLYFYSISMAYTKNAYLEAQGLFHESRKLYIAEAVSNLILNIFLCLFLGTTGILIATILTIVVFNFAGGTIILFKYYFKRSSRQFNMHHCFYFAVTVIAGAVTYYICSLLPFQGVLGLIIKAAICIVLPNILYLAFYFRFPQFNNLIMLIKSKTKTE